MKVSYEIKNIETTEKEIKFQVNTWGSTCSHEVTVSLFITANTPVYEIPFKIQSGKDEEHL